MKNNLIYAAKLEDGFLTVITEEGRKCEFLQFLYNVSNFSWRDMQKSGTLTSKQARINDLHLVSKLCAIGYLMQPVKERNFAKAIIAVDTDKNEMGSTGKSLLGKILKSVLASESISGRQPHFAENPFVWQFITEATKLACIDDLNELDIDSIIYEITGEWIINKKMQKTYIIPFEKTPKMYITTPHKFKRSDPSFMRRICYICFSDYYNQSRTPADDFGHILVDNWNDEQWKLTNRLLIECMNLYLEFGFVEVK